MYSLPEYGQPNRDLTLYLNGEPLPTGVPDVFIRQPFPEDLIQATAYERQVTALYRVEDENIQRLMQFPPEQDELDALKEAATKREKAIALEKDPTRKKLLNDRVEAMYAFVEGRTAADRHVESYGTQMTNLWYARRLAADKDGKGIEFDALPSPQQTRIFEEIEGILEDISMIPFVLPE